MMTDTDLEEIRQLFARYSHTLDFGDSDGFVACFTPDGLLDTSASDVELAGIHNGPDALKKFATTSADFSAGCTRQSALNVLVDGDGERARASSFVLVTRAHDDVTNAYGKPSEVTRSSLDTTGMYFDELAKVDGRWLFSRRQFRYDGTPDVLDRLFAPVRIGPAD